MINIIDKRECCGCAACASACPAKCITIVQDDEGFVFPNIDRDRCLNCGICDCVCPFNVKIQKAGYLQVYAGYATKIELRVLSSSGGVFSVIAEKILEQGGIIFGVRMSQDCESCYFAKVTTVPELSVLRGSKYLQADSIGVFEDVEHELISGKLVLFSGTPCQVNGLRTYLRKEYTKLLCLDFVCHGVPSPLLWKKYKIYLEHKKGIKITGVDFRSKYVNWTNLGFNMESEEKAFYIPKNYSSYFQMFMKNLSLRSSCYACKAKENRMADITIGDCWGVENFLSEFNDEKGCSLIIVRTSKGTKVIDRIKHGLKLKGISYEDAVSDNLAEYKSMKMPQEREQFFKDMNTLPWYKFEDKYIYPRVKHKVKKFLMTCEIWDALEKRRYGIENKFDYQIKICYKKR